MVSTGKSGGGGEKQRRSHQTSRADLRSTRGRSNQRGEDFRVRRPGTTLSAVCPGETHDKRYDDVLLHRTCYLRPGICVHVPGCARSRGKARKRGGRAYARWPSCLREGQGRRQTRWPTKRSPRRSALHVSPFALSRLPHPGQLTMFRVSPGVTTPPGPRLIHPIFLFLLR